MKKNMWTMVGCVFLFLQGCVASPDGSIHTDIAEAYHSTNQTQKGMLAGGALGAGIGGIQSGLGWLPGAGIGAGLGLIAGGAIGSYLDSRLTLVDRLENRGIKVIVLGDHVLVVVPSALLFEFRTNVFRPYAYTALDLIAAFINQYPNVLVSVGAHTGRFKLPPSVNKALSKEQANAIVRYFWIKKVNTRLISGVAYGDSQRVVKDTLQENENDRIEIKWEKMPV